MPASNKTYWRKKMQRNRERDKEVTTMLRRQGWKVIRVWEHTLNQGKAIEIVAKVRRTITAKM